MRSRLLPLPARGGPAEFGDLGRMVAVRCPQELAHIVQRRLGAWLASLAGPHHSSERAKLRDLRAAERPIVRLVPLQLLFI